MHGDRPARPLLSGDPSPCDPRRVRVIPPPCPVCLAEPPGDLIKLELDDGFAWWHCCALAGAAAWARLDGAAPSPQMIGGRPVYAAREAGWREPSWWPWVTTSSPPSWRLQLLEAARGAAVGLVCLLAVFGAALALMWAVTGR